VGGGGFSTIVASQTLSPTGGTVGGSANGAKATVTIPPGSLRHGGQVVLSAGAPGAVNVGKGSKVIADFSVTILDPTSGRKLAGPFAPPITVSISDPSITAGDVVVVVTTTGELIPVPGAKVLPGVATAPLTPDPYFAVVQATTVASPGGGVSGPGKTTCGKTSHRRGCERSDRCPPSKPDLELIPSTTAPRSLVWLCESKRLPR
jgi:hypothetical protein